MTLISLLVFDRVIGLFCPCVSLHSLGGSPSEDHVPPMPSTASAPQDCVLLKCSLCQCFGNTFKFCSAPCAFRFYSYGICAACSSHCLFWLDQDAYLTCRIHLVSHLYSALVVWTAPTLTWQPHAEQHTCQAGSMSNLLRCAVDGLMQQLENRPCNCNELRHVLRQILRRS